MSGGFLIGRVFGIPIYLHPTWFLVFLLVTYVLASQLAASHADWSDLHRYAWAGVTSVLFFGSILLHELGHSVLAQRHHVAVRSITLFVFGGVALMERDPDSARAEFEIAIAGPVVSASLALACSAAARLAPEGSGPAFALGWLYQINLLVALFNLLPGFPLDGGRVLRAVLWARSGDPARATRIAAGVGQFIAYTFVAVGALQVVSGYLGGLWLAFIGWFLLSASGATIRQLAIDESLAGLRAIDIMAPVPARVDASSTVGAFARELVMHGRRWALVEERGRLLGLVTLSDVKRLPPETWETTSISRIATPTPDLVTAAPETPVRQLLQTLSARDLNQIPILDAERVVGAVTRETLVHAIELRRRTGA